MPRSLLPPLLLTALVALLFVPGPPAAEASSRQAMAFEAPGELLDDGTRDGTLDQIKGFGVDRVRVLMYWKTVAPDADSATRPSFDASDPAAYPAGGWAAYDRLLAAAEQRGIEVFVTLAGPVPRWATRARRDNLTDPSAAEFEAFATAAGRRYGARVRMWSIWNEPNQPQFLLPQFRGGRATSPAIYRRLLIAGVKGLRTTPANASDTILAGETSPRGNRRIVAPLAFLRGTLCLDRRYRKRARCARLDVDGYAHHAYTTRVGPTFKPPDGDDVTIGVLSRLTTALDRAGRAKAIPARLGVHLTEFGIQSVPDRALGVSLARQAEYLAISERIAYRNARVRSFSQYLLNDDQPRAGDASERYGGFESGLRFADGRAKPSYDGFRLPLVVAASGRSHQLWGRVRPASGATTVTLEYRARGAAAYRALPAVPTTAAGVFSTRTSRRSGASYRVRWTAPDGQVFTGPPIRGS